MSEESDERAILEARFTEHSAMADLWIARINADRNVDLVVDKGALLLAVKSAYIDVKRYKIYHQDKPEIQKANAVKRTAYLAKWILKTHPIGLRNGEVTEKIEHILINAAFAIRVAQSHISGEIGKEFALTLDKEWELIYDMTFREINGDGFLAIFQTIYDLVRQQPVLETL